MVKASRIKAPLGDPGTTPIIAEASTALPAITPLPDPIPAPGPALPGNRIPRLRNLHKVLTYTFEPPEDSTEWTAVGGSYLGVELPAHQGATAGWVAASGVMYAPLYRNLSGLTPGASYELHVWVTTEHASSPSKVRLNIVIGADPGAPTRFTVLGSSIPETDWSEHVVSFIPNTATLPLSFAVETDFAGGFVGVDDIVVFRCVDDQSVEHTQIAE